jgi:hypothetical protein
MLHLVFILNFVMFWHIGNHPQGDLTTMYGYKSAMKLKFFCILTTYLNNA